MSAELHLETRLRGQCGVGLVKLKMSIAVRALDAGRSIKWDSRREVISDLNRRAAPSPAAWLFKALMVAASGVGRGVAVQDWGAYAAFLGRSLSSVIRRSFVRGKRWVASAAAPRQGRVYHLSGSSIISWATFTLAMIELWSYHPGWQARCAALQTKDKSRKGVRSCRVGRVFNHYRDAHLLL